MKNLVIGQSGGPTAVINASLYGAVKAFKESGTDGHVLGMINGIEGFLADHVMDLSTDLSDEELELLKLTPAAYLGSCRYKPPLFPGAMCKSKCCRFLLRNICRVPAVWKIAE